VTSALNAYIAMSAPSCLCGAVLDAGVTGGVPEFAGAGALALLYGLNPMAGVIDGFRWALTGHGQPPGAAMAASAIGVCVCARRPFLFPANGNEYRRPRLESSDALCFGQLAVAVYL